MISHRSSYRRRRSSLRRSHAFSITELLVVMGIIVLLVGLLLPALKAARNSAKRAATVSTMASFSKACEAFKLDHGQYPGVIPEEVLAANPLMSSTENAILHLCGGYRVLTPQDPAGGPVDTDYNNYSVGSCTLTELVFGAAPNQYRIKVDTARIGEGPYVNGKPHAPYFTPKGDEFAAATGQLNEPHPPLGACPNAEPILFHDLLDGWGQPILFVRSRAQSGPLVTDITVPTQTPQFLRGGITPYTDSGALGELGMNELYNAGSNPGGSILTAQTAVERDKALGQIIRAPAFGAANLPEQGTARGQYALISAGADGIYFSAWDGPGSSSNPVWDIVNAAGLAALKDYNDIVQTGGG